MADAGGLAFGFIVRCPPRRRQPTYRIPIGDSRLPIQLRRRTNQGGAILNKNVQDFGCLPIMGMYGFNGAFSSGTG